MVCSFGDTNYQRIIIVTFPYQSYVVIDKAALLPCETPGEISAEELEGLPGL